MALGVEVSEKNAWVVGLDIEPSPSSPEPGQGIKETQKFPTRGTEDSYGSED